MYILHLGKCPCAFVDSGFVRHFLQCVFALNTSKSTHASHSHDHDHHHPKHASAPYCKPVYQELEPILPLGEVSLDGADVQEVGKILSLVEADGTIVVQGKQGLVLDEGCVLASRVVELKENVRGGQKKADRGER